MNEALAGLSIDGWGAAGSDDDDLPPDAALIGMTAWRLGVNSSSANVHLDSATTLDVGARSAQRARYTGYACAMAILFAGTLAAALFELVRRPSRLAALTWHQMLRQDVGIYVLALTAFTAFWKLLSVTLALEWLEASLSWPAFVWLSELGDIFLYEMLALYLYAWTRMLGGRHGLGVPTIFFMIAYGAASVATLMHLCAVAESGRWSRVVVLLTAIAYLCCCYCYIGIKLWAVLVQQRLVMASASASAVAALSWLVLFYCFLLVIALLANGVLLALALGGLSSLATNLLASLADGVLLLNTTLFFLYSDFNQTRMGSAVKAMTASSSSSASHLSKTTSAIEDGTELDSRDLTVEGDVEAMH